MTATVQMFYIVAIVCFLTAALPHGTAIRFEFVAFACLVASQLVY